MLGAHIALKIRAINVFIASSNGSRYLNEFLEVGGILTILEILTLVQSTEEDKSEALKLILSIATNGRKYKEFICESYGVRQIAECMLKSSSEITLDYARHALVELGTVKLRNSGKSKIRDSNYEGIPKYFHIPISFSDIAANVMSGYSATFIQIG
jgi:hypothetical protein